MWVRWGLWVPQSFVVWGVTAFHVQSTYLVVTEATELWFWIPCNLVLPIGSYGEVAGKVHEWPLCLWALLFVSLLQGRLFIQRQKNQDFHNDKKA